jgi:hypothetical protein
MKLRLLLAFAALTATSSASAITITVDAELLKDNLGSAMPVTGLVILTAATTGVFNGPQDGAFVSGDEVIVFKWDLAAFTTPGLISDLGISPSPTGAWNQGDALRLYWYPTLDLASTAPVVNTPYGTYRDPAADPGSTLDGSDQWVTPANGATISLKFFTADATFLSPGGTNPASAGIASYLVPFATTAVPEPSSAFLLAGASALLLNRRRRS